MAEQLAKDKMNKTDYSRLNDDFEIWLANLRAKKRKIPPIKDWNRTGLINFARRLLKK